MSEIEIIVSNFTKTVSCKEYYGGYLNVFKDHSLFNKSISPAGHPWSFSLGRFTPVGTTVRVVGVPVHALGNGYRMSSAGYSSAE